MVRLNEGALKRFIEFQIKGGVEGLVPVGTTGENRHSHAKNKSASSILRLEQANGRVQIFAGAGSNNTAEVIEKVSLQTRRRRCSACRWPYYNKPTQTGYIAHFSAIADAVDIPLIIYNVPGRTGGNIAAETLLQMAEEIPNVAMVKEASGNLGQIMEIARSKPKNFSLLSGDDASHLP